MIKNRVSSKVFRLETFECSFIHLSRCFNMHFSLLEINVWKRYTPLVNKTTNGRFSFHIAYTCTSTFITLIDSLDLQRVQEHVYVNLQLFIRPPWTLFPIPFPEPLLKTFDSFDLQKVQERWYEKLHEWDKALSAYENKCTSNPDDVPYLLGRMRCLEALGQWYVFKWVKMYVR